MYINLGTTTERVAEFLIDHEFHPGDHQQYQRGE